MWPFSVSSFQRPEQLWHFTNYLIWMCFRYLTFLLFTLQLFLFRLRCLQKKIFNLCDHVLWDLPSDFLGTSSTRHKDYANYCRIITCPEPETEPERNKRCTLKKEKNCIHFPANATVVHSTDRKGDPSIANIWKNCYKVSMHCTYKTMTLSKETSVSDSSVSTRAVSKTCPSSFNRQNT